MIDRRVFLRDLSGTAAALALPPNVWKQQSDLTPIVREIARRHDETVQRLQTWIHQPSIAAENRGMTEGCELTMQMLRDAGFQQVTKIPSDGQPGIFATLDAGAPRTLGLYFMYDVKQVDPSEWSSPPWDAALVDKPGLGKVVIGRGAVNQKGPEATFLAALHAIRGANRKLPVNLVLVAEGEEEIGSPHFPQIVRRPEVLAALQKTIGIFMPSASQGLDGQVTMTLGAKGVIEVELVSSGEKWGRGPKKDVHSSLEAQVDSPSWHLVQALNTLIEKDGHTPAVEGFFDRVKPLSESQKKMVLAFAAKVPENTVKKEFEVEHWVKDEDWQTSLLRLYSVPTINIEGLVGGYTGPGGKTVLPHRAVAKIDMRLVPDMTAEDTLAKLKAHLAKHGFGDIEVNMSGGYNPTQTDPDSKYFKAVVATFTKMGETPLVVPRSPGSWPGYRFTDPPLSLPAGDFGLGHGTGAHAPDEYYLIESTNPNIQGLDGAVSSFVEFLYAIA